MGHISRMTGPFAWKNGEVLPFAELSLHAADLGVVAGASITEMARTFGHKTFRLDKHVQRLQESCLELGFPMEYSASTLTAAAENVVAVNCQLIDTNDDLGIVVFATAGANRTYVGAGKLPSATVAVHTFRLPFELWRTSATQGIRLSISSRTQIDGTVLPVHRKIRNRLHWWLADREADAASPGSRALLLDSQGRITETSNACFYGVLNGEIVTPQSNVLESMSRRIVEEAARNAGMTLRPCDLYADDIAAMSEAFVSSTPFGVFRVQSIDETQFDPADSVVPCLNACWEQLTGINPTVQILHET